MWKSNMEPSNKCNSQVEPATCCSGRFSSIVCDLSVSAFLLRFLGWFLCWRGAAVCLAIFPGLKIERAGLNI